MRTVSAPAAWTALVARADELPGAPRPAATRTVRVVLEALTSMGRFGLTAEELLGILQDDAGR